MADSHLIDIKNLEINKNLFFDEKNWCLLEIKKYNLKWSNSSKLALIYFENRNHIGKNNNKNIISFSEELSNKYINKSDDIKLDYILMKEYKYNTSDRTIISNILGNYTDEEKLLIISNLKQIPKSNIFNFLESFENLNKTSKYSLNKISTFKYMEASTECEKYNKITKYNLNEINDLTLYFLLKDKGVDLNNKYSSDQKRKYIVDFIKVIKNDLNKSSIHCLFNKWKNREILLKELVKSLIIL